jgi:hypothetical protein
MEEFVKEMRQGDAMDMGLLAAVRAKTLTGREF